LSERKGGLYGKADGRGKLLKMAGGSSEKGRNEGIVFSLEMVEKACEERSQRIASRMTPVLILAI